uniref:Uncharacterized protein n=1 Tax=Pithovirus LCDPAC02 TaxID=2506601 RepID=A0A481YPM1_9VIRU|nr:MAG: hypothetical protein LCDPAC02_03900 [Pithovirus LCDPAC02]
MLEYKPGNPVNVKKLKRYLSDGMYIELTRYHMNRHGNLDNYNISLDLLKTFIYIRPEMFRWKYQEPNTETFNRICRNVYKIKSIFDKYDPMEKVIDHVCSRDGFHIINYNKDTLKYLYDRKNKKINKKCKSCKKIIKGNSSENAIVWNFGTNKDPDGHLNKRTGMTPFFEELNHKVYACKYKGEICPFSYSDREIHYAKYIGKNTDECQYINVLKKCTQYTFTRRKCELHIVELRKNNMICSVCYIEVCSNNFMEWDFYSRRDPNNKFGCDFVRKYISLSNDERTNNILINTKITKSKIDWKKVIKNECKRMRKLKVDRNINFNPKDDYKNRDESWFKEEEIPYEPSEHVKMLMNKFLDEDEYYFNTNSSSESENINYNSKDDYMNRDEPSERVKMLMNKFCDEDEYYFGTNSSSESENINYNPKDDYKNRDESWFQEEEIPYEPSERVKMLMNKFCDEDEYYYNPKSNININSSLINICFNSNKSSSSSSSSTSQSSYSSSSSSSNINFNLYSSTSQSSSSSSSSTSQSSSSSSSSSSNINFNLYSSTSQSSTSQSSSSSSSSTSQSSSSISYIDQDNNIDIAYKIPLKTNSKNIKKCKIYFNKKI